jgi:hypothetical protein
MNRYMGSVAAPDLIALRNEVLPAAPVLETQIRTSRDRHMRTLVLPIHSQPARSRGTAVLHLQLKEQCAAPSG